MQTIEEVEEFLQERAKLGIKLGLGRIEAMLDALSHPEKTTKMIHVAGTNGKGSTIQLMKDACVMNGAKVGLFTSPSFHGIHGHFFINGKMITDAAVIKSLNEMTPVIKELDQAGDAPTAFEIITVLAFLYFQAEKVDYAFIETGMGGREDTTNCFQPVLSVITNVAKDHMQFLGESLAEITSHKAGIIKANCPVVTGPLQEVSKAIIKDRAADLAAPLFIYGEDFTIKNRKESSFTWTDGKKTEEIKIKLKGSHQAENAALAWMALRQLQELGFNFDWHLMKQSFATTTLEGRLEEIQTKPTILLDSAHNLAAIEKLSMAMKELYPKREIRILFAGFKDKQLAAMIRHLGEISPKITLTSFDHERAARKEDFATNLMENKSLSFTSSWQVFIKQISTSKSDTIWLMTGSLHFITEVRSFMKNLSNAQ